MFHQEPYPEPDPMGSSFSDPKPDLAKLPEPDPMGSSFPDPRPDLSKMPEPDPMGSSDSDPKPEKYPKPDPLKLLEPEPDPEWGNPETAARHNADKTQVIGFMFPDIRSHTKDVYLYQLSGVCYNTVILLCHKYSNNNMQYLLSFCTAVHKTMRVQKTRKTI